MTRAALLPAAFAVLYLTASVAQAREVRRVVAAEPEACVQICPGDYAPCDPAYFKKAEDRCGWETKGRRR